jgi:hypothetical protein
MELLGPELGTHWADFGKIFGRSAAPTVPISATSSLIRIATTMYREMDMHFWLEQARRI